MKSAIRLFLVLVTLTVIVVSWLTHQLSNPRIQYMIIILVGLSLVVFFTMNVLEHREERRKRAERESPEKHINKALNRDQKRSDTSFALKDRKSGLTWGGGNIKASEATRGTKRKFLGR